jgi:nitrate reductase NapAB chaperone NapD
LTPNEISVLKLDPKFQITPNKLNIERFIACVESKLRLSNKNKAEIEKIRNSLVQVLSKAVIPTPNLTKEQMQALKRLKNNKNIIITNSDKSNKTVVLNKIDYIKKVEDVLSDSEIYTEIDNDRTNCIASQIITRLKYLKTNKFIK